jgi:AcrR family transcriptional regulator
MSMPKTEGATEDLELISALLSNPTVRGAAEAAGVSESTVYRRLRDSTFRRELKEQRLRVFSHALQRLQVVAAGAVEVLEEVMQDRTTPEAACIKAAETVLKLASSDPQPEMVDRRLQSTTERMLEDL